MHSGAVIAGDRRGAGGRCWVHWRRDDTAGTEELGRSISRGLVGVVATRGIVTALLNVSISTRVGAGTAHQ